MTRHFGGMGANKGNQRAKTVGVLLGLFLLGVLLLVVSIFFGSTSATSNVVPQQAQVDTRVDAVEVLVPVKNIEAGTELVPELFRKEARPKIGLSPRIVKDYEEIKGFYARSLIAGDQPLHSDYITHIKPTNPLTAKIPEGYRAVTITVNARTSVEGWARPGARVDVVWASRIRGEETITVIVQNAQILSAERQTDANGAPGQENENQGQAQVPSTVTLLVTAKDAAKIQLASQTGSLSLQLRGDADKGKGEEAQRLSLGDLYGRDESNGQTSGPVVRVKGANGQYEEWILKDGKLVPKE